MLPVVKEGVTASVSMGTRQEPICAAVRLAWPQLHGAARAGQRLQAQHAFVL